jgi:CRISPR-associated exonuclease Cas4
MAYYFHVWKNKALSASFAGVKCVRTVSVSGAVACHVCPVRYYMEQEMERGESLRYTIAKQIAAHFGGELDSDAIWGEVRAILPEAAEEHRTLLDDWVTRCRETDWRTAAETEVAVTSSRLGIHGVVDRLFPDEPYFAIVRSSEAPAAGIYGTDRIRVACYAACMEELLGIPVRTGLVEYVPSGTARPCVPQPRDRRAALRAIRMATEINAGAMPRKPIRAPCETCTLQEHCSFGGRRLSDLL